VSVEPAAAQRRELYSPNRLKLGVFGPNLSSGLAKTKVPERWSGSWRDNVALAQMLDDAGMEFILPVGRWKGYGGETDPQAATFETLTWATGMLAATRRITVFGTVHVPLIHPVYAAKMCVTADHVGTGRFGLNVVCGSHQNEFEMFGEPLRPSAVAYEYGGEWLAIVTRLWEGGAPFDFDGMFFHLRGLEALPRPFGETRPLVLNAGNSPAGKTFAMHYADHLFTGFGTLEQAAETTRAIRDGAATFGRTVGIFSAVNVVCRPTTREADDYYRYYADEMADWAAVDAIAGDVRRRQAANYDGRREDRVRQAAGYGGYPCVGDPDRVADELAKISAAGFGGLALGFVNYLDEFPYFRDHVLPRLEARGIRDATAASPSHH